MAHGKGGGRGKGEAFMKQMGLFGADMEETDDDDQDLEAELLRITKGVESGQTSKSTRKAAATRTVLAAESMNDVVSGDDDDSSADEEEFMKELEGLSCEDEDEGESAEAAPTPPAMAAPTPAMAELLEERLGLYRAAVSTVTDSTAKRRRCERAIKTLQTQLRDVRAGKDIDKDEVPPPIAIPKSGPPLSEESEMSSALSREEPRTTDAAPLKLSTGGTGPPKPSMGGAGPPKPSTSGAAPPKPSTGGAGPPKPGTGGAGLSESSTGGAGPSESSTDNAKLMLTKRRAHYHKAALLAKQRGDAALARKYLSIRKDFDNVISAVEEGHHVDLSQMPGEPSDGGNSLAVDSSKKTTESQPKPDDFLSDVAAPTREEAKALFGAPEPASDTLGALQQRLAKYEESEQQALEQSNSSKARRMKRIVQQYLAAIKSCKAGKPFDYSELPTPPGFQDIPLPNAATSQAQQQPAQRKADIPPNAVTSPPQQLPVQHSAAIPSQVVAKTQPATSVRSEATTSKPKVAKRQASLSIQERQLEVLLERQEQYKKAALAAKTHDDKELALKYMRIVKGMNPMIQAATNGLPVAMGQVPPPPASTHETGYVVVDVSQIPDHKPEERLSEFEKIIKELKEQIRSSCSNAVHFKAVGDLKNSFV